MEPKVEPIICELLALLPECDRRKFNSDLDHGAEHGKKTLETALMISEDITKQGIAVNQTSLAVASYFHDLGMVAATTLSSLSFVREKHMALSALKLRKVLTAAGKSDEFIQEVLKVVMEHDLPFGKQTTLISKIVHDADKLQTGYSDMQRIQSYKKNRTEGTMLFFDPDVSLEERICWTPLRQFIECSGEKRIVDQLTVYLYYAFSSYTPERVHTEYAKKRILKSRWEMLHGLDKLVKTNYPGQRKEVSKVVRNYAEKVRVKIGRFR